jgi:hypothetical protein
MHSEIAVEPPTVPGPLPLFYKSPRVLDPARHAKAGLAEGNLAFAAGTNSVPLAADEFFVAQGHYPIVFTAGANPTAVAVVGLASHKNLFVDGEGRWKTGAYIPAYVRRYPFVFVQGAENRLVLAVDEAADAYVAEGGRNFFEGDQPSANVKRALEFCTAFQREFERAQAFSAAVAQQGLLIDYRADMRPRNGAPVALTGFRIIDESKLNAMPDDVFLEWRRRGWVAMAYAHLMSMHRWSALGMMVEEPNA